MVTNKAWKWYQRHKEAVNLMLEFAKEVVPGAGIVIKSLQMLLARKNDDLDADKKAKLEEMGRFLEEIKPIVADAVDEIEDHPEFASICSLPEEEMLQRGQKILLEDKDIHDEIEKIMPQFSQSLVTSVAKLSNQNKSNILVGRYQLIEKIGQGGQGEVWKVKHDIAQTTVAIKFLPVEISQDQNAIASIREEYKNVTKLIHPNIVQYRELDYDSESRRYFLVMDYVAGTTFRIELIRLRKNPMSFTRAIKTLEPIGEALSFAHQKGIVHCDLKPENIILQEGSNSLMLTDFGLAQEIRNSMSMRSMKVDISGTMPYMAPEQYNGRRATTETDMWALGVILYEMVAGYHPFHGTSFEHYMKLICEQEPERPESLNDGEWEAIKKMLAKDREKRIAHFSEVKLAREDKPKPQIEVKEKIVKENKNHLFEPIPKGIPEIDPRYLREEPIHKGTVIEAKKSEREPNSNKASNIDDKIDIVCPHCNASMKSKINSIGKTGICPKCKNKFTISSEKQNHSRKEKITKENKEHLFNENGEKNERELIEIKEQLIKMCNELPKISIWDVLFYIPTLGIFFIVKINNIFLKLNTLLFVLKKKQNIFFDTLVFYVLSLKNQF